MNNLIAIAKNAYDRFAAVAASLQNPLLLAIRLYWGWQFEQDGRGKLMHLDRATDFFATINLPAPHMTALLVALVEFVGGILLALGIFSRLLACTFLQHDDSFSRRPRRSRRLLPHVFQARRLLWRKPLHILVCSAPDSDPGSWPVRHRHATQTQVLVESD